MTTENLTNEQQGFYSFIHSFLTRAFLEMPKHLSEDTQYFNGYCSGVLGMAVVVHLANYPKEDMEKINTLCRKAVEDVKKSLSKPENKEDIQ